MGIITFRAPAVIQRGRVLFLSVSQVANGTHSCYAAYAPLLLFVHKKFALSVSPHIEKMLIYDMITMQIEYLSDKL